MEKMKRCAVFLDEQDEKMLQAVKAHLDETSRRRKASSSEALAWALRETFARLGLNLDA